MKGTKEGGTRMRRELGYIYISMRLFDLSCEKDSEITHSHLLLYSRLSERANWQIKPAETGKLSIHEIMNILGWKKVYFYKVLDDLIKHEFIERVYDDGKKRSSFLKVRFLPDP